MRKTTQRTIKGYVKDGAAVDLTNYNFEQMRDFLHAHSLDKIAYSTGIYGINAGLLQDRESGQLYAITARNTALSMAF